MTTNARERTVVRKLTAIGTLVALVMALAACAAPSPGRSASGRVAAQASFDPSPVLDTPVTRVTQPIQLQTRQTLDPVPDSYVPPVSAGRAFENVPMEVAAFAGQPKAVYLGAVSGAPVYVFRYDYCLPPAGGGGGSGAGGSTPPSASVDPCANGATYDALISADTGDFIVAGQITNSSNPGP